MLYVQQGAIMSDVMVTGRMSSAKKKAGNQVLSKLGMNASQAINQLYDFLIEKQSLPFSTEKKKSFSLEDLQAADKVVRSFTRKNKFSNMTDSEIKASRLQDLLSK